MENVKLMNMCKVIDVNTNKRSNCKEYYNYK